MISLRQLLGLARPAPALTIAEIEAQAKASGFIVLREGETMPAPMTCAEAGRGGYVVRHQREREKIRATTIRLAEKIGRPELAEPLR